MTVLRNISYWRFARKIFLLTYNGFFGQKMQFFQKNFFSEPISFFRVPGAGRVKLIINSTVHGLYGEPRLVSIGQIVLEIKRHFLGIFWKFF